VSPHAAPVRASWLVLAVDGPAIQVPVEVPGTAIRVVGDPVRFRALLLAERPRIVVCSEPPADRSTLELVLPERRRRARMRAVHMAPPGAGDARLAALAAGFCDAITSATPLSELAGILTWLD